METLTVELAELVPDDENPRTHDSRNLDAIRESLTEHGQVEPLVVQKSTMRVIAGNGRMEALKTMGHTQASVVLLDVDDKQARKLSIALNRTGELAGWDEGTLASHLKALSELDFDFSPVSIGFSEQEMEELLASFSGDIDKLGLEPPGIDEDGNPLPPGTQPADMPTSGVRMVQLFLDETTAPKFQMWVRGLAETYGTDNITDTVYRAVQECAVREGGCE
jgi:hypothetical protein